MHFLLISLFYSNLVQAKILDVPENCFTLKKAPCLTQIQEEEQILQIQGIHLRATKDSIVQWIAFDKVEIEILKGFIHITQNAPSLKVNEIFVKDSNQMVQRLEEKLLALDLNTFMLSEFQLAQVKSNSVLLKARFLEKAELIVYISRFFDRKSAFVTFLKSMEKRWNSEFTKQANSQTKVLERSVASTQDIDTKIEKEKIQESNKIKKVREQFFYRTFYR